jgi:hypothetical protein
MTRKRGAGRKGEHAEPEGNGPALPTAARYRWNRTRNGGRLRCLENYQPAASMTPK